MSAVRPEDREQRNETVGAWTVRLTTYRVGELYRCEIDNIDPGAKIARGSGPSRSIAEQDALEKAQAALSS